MCSKENPNPCTNEVYYPSAAAACFSGFLFKSGRLDFLVAGASVSECRPRILSVSLLVRERGVTDEH